ncbi:MAG: SLBB domain-containing protein [Balneolaceae bacterium]
MLSTVVLAQQSQQRDAQSLGGLSFQDGQLFFADPLADLQSLQRPIPAGYISDNYVLGSGDLISVFVDGPASITARAVLVNAQGIAFLPSAGAVRLGGLSYAEAEQAVKQAYARVLQEFELLFTIERPRQVTLHITGDVPQAGRYDLPPGLQLDVVVNQLLPGLFDSPGQSQRSTFFTRDGQNVREQFPLQNARIPVFSETAEEQAERRIQRERLPDISLRQAVLKRQSGAHAAVDLPRYYNTGESAYNPFIYDGDVLTVRVLREEHPTISLSGAVERPLNLEYTADDQFDTLLHIAGGFTSDADSAVVHLFRSETPGTRAERSSLSLADIRSQSLQPNDRIVVPRREQAGSPATAWVYGEALIPGNFPITDAETSVADLLEMAGGVTPRALPNAAYILRETPSENRTTDQPSRVDIEGLKRYSDQIRQGFEYLELEERLGSDSKLFVDLTNPENYQNVRILAGDQLHIPRDVQTVVLFGQINNPGNYPFRDDLGVRDYLGLAGGLSLAADRERVFVIKAGSRVWKRPNETNLQSGDMIFVDRIPFDELDSQRSFELELRQDRRSNIQVVLTAVSTVAAIVTTAVVVLDR